MFVELHMIQNFAPANLNRDDTNNPKDCEFGGVRRARVSSQCIKRAIRTCPVFAETTGVDVGMRTKWLIGLLRDRLIEADQSKDEAEVTAVLNAFVPTYASKLEKGSEKTAVLLYLGGAEVDSLVQALLENWQNLADEKAQADTLSRLVKALVKAHKGQTSAPDIALFGRMLAEKPELSLEAASQVAHAISTHRVTMEMDFFTAVDDRNPEDTAGAGMMGFTGFDSACFYRYARIDWNQLVDNLNGDAGLARRTVEGFLRAAVAAVPSGKQSSFAAQNPPSFLLAVVRQDGMGWSLANAFERPVSSRGNNGLIIPSVAALDAYWGRLCQVYGTGTLACTTALALEPDLALESLEGARVDNLEDWVGAVTGALPVEEGTV
jgi:CRISPR system Cascade subunit CasC